MKKSVITQTFLLFTFYTTSTNQNRGDNIIRKFTATNDDMRQSLQEIPYEKVEYNSTNNSSSVTSIKKFTYPIFQKKHKLSENSTTRYEYTSEDFNSSLALPVKQSAGVSDNNKVNKKMCLLFVPPPLLYDADTVATTQFLHYQTRNNDNFCHLLPNNNSYVCPENTLVLTDCYYSNNMFSKPDKPLTDNMQIIPTIQNMCNKSQINVSDKPNSNDIKLPSYKEAVKTCKKKELNFFYTILNLLKSLIYFRYNIASFFNILFKHNNVLEGQNKEKQFRMQRFLALAAQYASTLDDKVDNNVRSVDQNIGNEIMCYEKYLINESSNMIDIPYLNESKEYMAIKSYNRHYLLILTGNIKNSDFESLYIFLFPFFQYSSISRYYPMLVSLLKSIHDLSAFVARKLDKSLQSHILDLGVFEVDNCMCSRKLKQKFVFHWVICWITCFSNNYSAPEYTIHKENAWSVISYYPKEVVIQFIFLIHLIINYKNDNITLKDLEKNFIVRLRSTITNLLFGNETDLTNSLFHSTIKDLFRNTSEIVNHKIHKKYSVYNIRKIQTHEENIEFSNKLIPALNYIVQSVINVAKMSYNKTKKTTL